MRKILDVIIYKMICSYITSISAEASIKDGYDIDICVWRDGSSNCPALAMCKDDARNLRDQLNELLKEDK